MRLNPDYHVHNIAGEYIIIRPGTVETDLTGVISFNVTAAWLWDQFRDGRDFTPGDAASALTAHYDVDGETALADARAWVEVLRKHNLLLP